MSEPIRFAYVLEAAFVEPAIDLTLRDRGLDRMPASLADLLPGSLFGLMGFAAIAATCAYVDLGRWLVILACVGMALPAFNLSLAGIWLAAAGVARMRLGRQMRSSLRELAGVSIECSLTDAGLLIRARGKVRELPWTALTALVEGEGPAEGVWLVKAAEQHDFLLPAAVLPEEARQTLRERLRPPAPNSTPAAAETARDANVATP